MTGGHYTVRSFTKCYLSVQIEEEEVWWGEDGKEKQNAWSALLEKPEGKRPCDRMGRCELD